MQDKRMRQEPTARIDAIPRARPPRVSVIVTNHNYGRYLTPCLEAVAAQSYERIECIVVDDGSTDDSATVLATLEATWQRDTLIVARNETAQGQYSAMRRGLQAASGQFVVFVDADDLLDPDFVATHVACHLSEQVYAALSTSDQWLIDEEGHLLGVNPRGKFRPFQALPRRLIRKAVLEDPFVKDKVVVEEIAADANHAGYWIWGTTSSMMFRRDVLDLITHCDFDMRVCADEYLANFAHAIGGTAIVRKALGMYRRHGGNNIANNAVFGGFVPLTRRSSAVDPDPRACIAKCLEQDSGRFSEALGERLFATLVMRFCPLGRGLRILRGSKIGRRHVVGQLARRYVRSMTSAFQTVHREVLWLFHRQPTYW